jgi:hypothetical protein
LYIFPDFLSVVILNVVASVQVARLWARIVPNVVSWGRVRARDFRPQYSVLFKYIIKQVAWNKLSLLLIIVLQKYTNTTTKIKW